MSVTPLSVEQRVQARAYALWEEDGRPEGRSDRHWHQARAEIEREDANAAQSRSGASPAGAKKRKSGAAYWKTRSSTVPNRGNDAIFRLIIVARTEPGHHALAKFRSSSPALRLFAA